MLVKCRNCGISFDHKMGRCLGCGTVAEASGEERIALLAEEAADRLRGGGRKVDVRSWLENDVSLPGLDTDEVLRRAGATVKNESRKHGRHVVISGVVLLLIAFAVFVFTGGFVIASGCLALGLAMVVLGEIKVVTGWNITGRDDG